jgi:[protein-PII] uridylyltransferase
VQDGAGEPYGAQTARALDRLAEALAAAARGEASPGEPRRILDLGRMAAFAITPEVMFDNEASEGATVIETTGRDRPGLLADLARTLSDAELSIVSAHIDNYGERAVDAFYVTDPGGGKVLDARKQGALKAALEKVLGEEAEAAGRRANLQRARASAAR